MRHLLEADPPENCHLTVKNCQILDIFSKNCQKLSFFKLPLAIFFEKMTILAIFWKNVKYLAIFLYSNSNFQEGQHNIDLLQLRDTDIVILPRHIYCEEQKLAVINVVGIMFAADRYDLLDLRQACKNFFRGSIEVGLLVCVFGTNIFQRNRV